MKIQKVLSDRKGSIFHTIGASDTIKNAAKKMTEKEVSVLIVLEDIQKPDSYVGILTNNMIISECWKSDNFIHKKVEEVMSRQLLLVKPEDDVNAVMALIASTRVRHIPVWENDKIISVITSIDIIRSILAEKEATFGSMNELYGGGSFASKVF